LTRVKDASGRSSATAGNADPQNSQIEAPAKFSAPQPEHFIHQAPLSPTSLVSVLDPQSAREKGVRGKPASKSPAVDAEISQDLQAITDAWPTVPGTIKAGIVAMVKAAGARG